MAKNSEKSKKFPFFALQAHFKKKFPITQKKGATVKIFIFFPLQNAIFVETRMSPP